MRSAKRILTLVGYFLASIKRNKGKLIDLLIWPIVDILVFGFTSNYLGESMNNDLERLLAILLGSLIFWHFFSRISNEVYQQLFEEVVSKNLHNIVMSPVRNWELLVSLAVSGILKLVVNMAIILLVAYMLYGFSIFNNFGFTMVAVGILSLWGISLGIAIAAMLFLLGNKAMTFGWVVTGLVQPFSCVFYSRGVLPSGLREVSYLIPSSYVFEEYRNVISGNGVNMSSLWLPWGLNLGYLIMATSCFLIFLKMSRKTGLLAKI